MAMIEEMGGLGGAAQQASYTEQMKIAEEKKYRAALESAGVRRFNELISRVLQSVHLTNDHYGPLSVEEDSRTYNFKAEIQAVCKKYL